MSDDPGELVADAVVEFLNDPDRGYSMQFEASNPEDPDEALSGELPVSLMVLVVPVSETREGIDSGAVSVAPTVNVFVTRLRNETVTKKVLNALVTSIVRSLDFVDMGSFTWQKTETITKYDAEKLRTQDRFLSVFSLTYYDIE